MNTHSPTTSQSGAVEELDTSETFAPNWASDAPRGGRAVLNRILKESATVPLFFAQTLVQSLRDVGYNNTTSALCEHIDNAIEAVASEIRVYFRQTGRQGDFQTDIMVYDNGRGMPPNVLKVATAFGGSMSYGNRKGIGRFGMGMKTAALSVGPVMELYSWQEVPENPADFDVAIARVMATAARRDRSRRVQRTVEFASEPRAIDIVANLEARAEIARLARSIGHADYGLLRLIGEGWSYKEITVKIGGTEMTLRVKVSRLRGKLAA